MTSTPYANRRQRLAAQLGPHAVAIVPTAAMQPRNRDNEHPYRFDSYFYYLTGFTEPHAWLVLDGQGRSTLFCQPKDLAREIWDGYRLGPDAAPATLGVDQAFGVDALETELPKLLANQRAVWWPFATHPGLSERVQNWLTEVRAQARSGISCPQSQHDVCVVLTTCGSSKTTPNKLSWRGGPNQRRGSSPRHAALRAKPAPRPGATRIPP